MAFNRYLVFKQQGLIAPIMQVFLSIETGLKIRNADYKSIRRSPIDSIHSCPDKQKFGNKVICPRAKLRSSDSIEHLEKLA